MIGWATNQMAERKTEFIRHTGDSVNEKLWRGEVLVEELISLLQQMPLDGKVRIYGNKLQIVSPVDRKILTLDRVG